MNSAVIFTAFATGLAGSAHCIGMCGGISVSLGLGSMKKRLLPVYHLGRLASYTTLGLVFGSLLPLIGVRAYNAIWGASLRIAAALIMLAIGLQIVFGVNFLRCGDRSPVSCNRCCRYKRAATRSFSVFSGGCFPVA